MPIMPRDAVYYIFPDMTSARLGLALYRSEPDVQKQHALQSTDSPDQVLLIADPASHQVMEHIQHRMPHGAP